MTSQPPLSDKTMALALNTIRKEVAALVKGFERRSRRITAAAEPVLAEAERLQQQIGRLTEQSDLWHRGELDTTTAMAGIHGELHGLPLPEVGQWDRDRADEQAAREQEAAESAARLCPPTLRFPCGHCVHDLCQTCDRCCSCTCG